MSSWEPTYYAVGEGPDDLQDELERKEYAKFRTGLTFGDVRRMLAVEQRQTRDYTGDYMFVSRSTVLGRWHEIKQGMWRGDPPPDRNVTCVECQELADLEDICADCGDCHDCCSCSVTPQDDFWRENPWGGLEWYLTI